MPATTEQSKGSDRRRGLIALLLMIVAVALVLFGAAGTLDWPMAWCYLALVTAMTFVSRLLMARRNPGALEERARAVTVSGVEPGDRTLATLVGLVGPVVTLLVAGLDHRLGWSPASAPAVVIAAVVALFGATLFATWAMAVNPFFSAVARIQSERGHDVVAVGPYRLVRHPAYAASALATLAGPLMLDARWALIPAALTVIVLAVRTAREDRMLRRGLTGYEAYAAQTRYRLLPGVW